MNFYEIYYLSIIFFAFPVCFLSFKNELTIFKFFNSIIFVYLALLYLYTSLRIEGVDHYAYSRMFVGNEHSHDFGFKFLSFIFYKSQLTYASLLLFIYIINLFSIKKLSEYYNINFFICFLIMLCHVILVRDFSQVRIGFAISIFVFSLGQKNILLRLMIYFLAFSMHFTVIYLIIFYNFCNYLTNFKKYKKFYLVIVGVLLFLIVQNLEIFVFIDDRMVIYLNWDKHGYTRPVVFSNYLILVLHLFVMILGILKKVCAI